MHECKIRRFAGTAAEVAGLMAVEREAFGECPYSADELAERLRAPEQQVWLAEAQGSVVGFLAGIHTVGLRGHHLEADLLGVRRGWQGQGIATALLRALRQDAGQAETLRGVVRTANRASSGAFARAGFSPSPAECDLLLYRLRGWAPRPIPDWGGDIRPLAGSAEAASLRSLAPHVLPPAEAIWAASRNPRLLLLVAVNATGLVGAIELLEVHTLHYSGFWVEWLHVRAGHERARAALVASAVEAAKQRRLDEVGCLVPQGQWPLKALFLGEGFAPLDSYRIWTVSAPGAGGL